MQNLSAVPLHCCTAVQSTLRLTQSVGALLLYGLCPTDSVLLLLHFAALLLCRFAACLPACCSSVLSLHTCSAAVLLPLRFCRSEAAPKLSRKVQVQPPFHKHTVCTILNPLLAMVHLSSLLIRRSLFPCSMQGHASPDNTHGCFMLFLGVVQHDRHSSQVIKHLDNTDGSTHNAEIHSAHAKYVLK